MTVPTTPTDSQGAFSDLQRTDSRPADPRSPNRDAPQAPGGPADADRAGLADAPGFLPDGRTDGGQDVRDDAGRLPRFAGTGVSISEATIDEIYLAIVLQHRERYLLQRLCESLGAHAGAIFEIVYDGENPVAYGRHLCNISPRTIAAYRGRFRNSDPMLAICRDAADDETVVLSRRHDMAGFAESAYAREVNGPSRIGDMMSLRVRAGTLWSFSFYTMTGRVFDDAAIAGAGLLREHLARACRLKAMRDAPPPPGLVADPRFTPRERQILGHLRERRSYDEIAELCGFSRNTLKWHMQNIFGKAHARNLADLMADL